MWRFGGVYAYGIKRKYTKSREVMDAIAELAPRRTGKVDQFTEEQVRHLLRLAAERPYKAKVLPNAVINCAVNLAAYGGLRLGEILGLKVDAIDAASSCLYVRTSLNRFGRLNAPKTSSGIRPVMLPQFVIDLLVQFRATHHVANPAGLLFTNTAGKPIMLNTWTCAYWSPTLVRAGLKKSVSGPGLHFHALRHFHASWLLGNNEAVTDVSKRLGHAHAGITMSTYSHALKGAEHQRLMAERMGSAMRQDQPL